MKDLVARIIIIIPLLGVSCAPQSGHEQAATVPVSVESTYEPPRPTIVKEDGYKIARGATKLKDIKATFDDETHSMRLSGAIEYLPVQGGSYQKINVELTGALDAQGFIVLKPEPGSKIDEKVTVAAKATCLTEEGTCYSSFIDIYLYTDGVVYHHQVEAKQNQPQHEQPKQQTPVELPKREVQPPVEVPQDKKQENEKLRRPEKDDIIVPHKTYDDDDVEHEDGDDAAHEEEADDGRYIGTIPQDIETILQVKPELAPPTSKEERDERAEKEKKKKAETPEVDHVPVPVPRPENPPSKDDGKKQEPKKEEPKKQDPKKEDPKKDDAKKDDGKKGEPKKEEPKKPDTKQDEPVAKPKVEQADQSVGAVNAGRLENGVNMLAWEQAHAPTGYHIIRAFRKTHFATNEMAYMIRQIGKLTLNLVPNYTVPVGDVSLEKGGTIYNDNGKPRHKSHKSGRDADIGYYYEDKSLMGNLFSAIRGKKPLDSWMADKQWQLFKTIVRTQYVDRIFLHPALKHELCGIALKNGEIDKSTKSGVAFETLRRLIPDSGHDTHFHLRVKCSSAQYRCKQMVDPEAKTGCF